jgi:hypothetical protein
MPTEPKREKRPAIGVAKEQSERFKRTARELGCDETTGALDRAFGKISTKRGASRSRPSEKLASS